MSKKKDIRKYNDNELALLVMNNEYYYSLLDDIKLLFKLIKQNFIYTDKQQQILIDHIRNDYEDYYGL